MITAFQPKTRCVCVVIPLPEAAAAPIEIMLSSIGEIRDAFIRETVIEVPVHRGEFNQHIFELSIHERASYSASSYVLDNEQPLLAIRTDLTMARRIHLG